MCDVKYAPAVVSANQLNSLFCIVHHLKRSIRRRLAVMLGIVAVIGLPGSARSQARTGFYGTVKDSLGLPLAGVEVQVAETTRETFTDSSGRFSLPRMSPGFYHVLIRRLQYQPIAGTVRLSAGDSVDITFRMRAVPVALDTVRVRDRRPNGLGDDFERRRRESQGTFITQSTLNALSAWPLQNIIASRATRVQLVRLPAGGWGLASSTPMSCLDRSCPAIPHCFMSLWVDGREIYTPDSGESPPDLSQYDPQTLRGVEVYPGPATTPLELGGTGASCGVLVLWTRTGSRRE